MEKIFTCEKCGAIYRMEIAVLPEDKAILAWQRIKIPMNGKEKTAEKHSPKG